ncbi:hypothetical protein [Aliiglaciecola lipolytica]|uniref:LRAT domain-containing protein n=1 Tax=Aliiglaciecola lipolytica E3 TaxID=1127673 RepID=K6XT47_9ALTE|nr:hypothetical protein [Aliiglaciecola lipolytica]GAC14831.1 hypothetical protein GLIP_2203 [Aliiglaciecola lipolytica E3]
MPVPLIWIGAGLAAIYAGDKVRQANKVNRQFVQHYPGEVKSIVSPKDGAIVCCGIYGVFEHTGIWVDGNIIELKGNGLIRGISPQRFLTGRSGNQIFVLCDTYADPLIAPKAVESSVARLFEYTRYDLIRNNCHRFVSQCVAQTNQPVTSFSDLNRVLHAYFKTALCWYPTNIS